MSAFRGTNIRARGDTIYFNEATIFQQEVGIEKSVVIGGDVEFTGDATIVAPSVLTALGQVKSPNTIISMDVVSEAAFGYVPFIFPVAGIITALSGVAWQDEAAPGTEFFSYTISTITHRLSGDFCIIANHQGSTASSTFKYPVYDANATFEDFMVGVAAPGAVRYIFYITLGPLTIGDKFTLLMEFEPLPTIDFGDLPR